MNIILREKDKKETFTKTLKEVLEEINSDHSEEWTDYDASDFGEGLSEWTDWVFMGVEL